MTMTIRHRDERGVALVVAIFAMVIVGALVTGAFFMGMQEQQVGRNTLQLQEASAAADGGAQLFVADWEAGTNNVIPVGDSVTFGGWLQWGGGWYRGSARRLSEQTFLVRSEGFSADSMARQQVGILVRLRPFDISFGGALVVAGATKIGGSSFIDGTDAAPTGWADCAALEPAKSGLLVSDSSGVEFSGCNNPNDCLDGSPLIAVDTTMTSDSVLTFGELDFSAIAALADKVIGSGPWNSVGPTFDVSGDCRTTDLDNWGDPLTPTSACGLYFPIIYAPYSTKLTGGVGQGILLVEGDLEVSGGFQFFGPVIIKGILKTTGTGGHFNGGVAAANVDLGQNVILGNALVNFSSCALSRALNSTAPVAQMRERGWINLN